MKIDKISSCLNLCLNVNKSKDCFNIQDVKTKGDEKSHWSKCIFNFNFYISQIDFILLLILFFYFILSLELFLSQCCSILLSRCFYEIVIVKIFKINYENVWKVDKISSCLNLCLNVNKSKDCFNIQDVKTRAMKKIKHWC